MRLITALILLLATSTSCSPLAPLGRESCVSRNGACFDLAINGQPVVPLGSRAALSRYESGLDAAGVADLRSTTWMLQAPIDGKIVMNPSINERGAEWFGENAQAELMFRALTPVKLRMKRELREAEGVRVQGRGVIVEENVLADEKLPPGEYIFIVTARGTRNWDRKHIHAVVK